MADSSSQQRLDEANTSFREGRIEDALQQFQSLVADDVIADDAKPSLHTNVGAALERLGRYEESISAYDEALALNPQHVEALHNKGVALKRLGRYDEALSCFDAALERRSMYLPALRGRTEVFLKQEKYDEALEAANRAIEVADEEKEVYSDRAFVYVKQGDYDASIADYEYLNQCGALNDASRVNYSVALSQRAMQLEEEGNPTEAEEYYTVSLAHHDATPTVFNRALVRLRQGNYEGAEEGFREVLSREPSHSSAILALGTLMVQQERFEDALSWLSRAAEENPGKKDVIYNLGIVRYQLGQFSSAVTQFQRALEIDPDFDAAKNALAAAQSAQAAAGGGSAGAGEAPAPPGPPSRQAPPPPKPISRPEEPKDAREEQGERQREGQEEGSAEKNPVEVAPAAAANSSPVEQDDPLSPVSPSFREGSPTKKPKERRTSRAARDLPPVPSAGSRNVRGKIKTRASMMAESGGAMLPPAQAGDESIEGPIPEDEDGYQGVIYQLEQLQTPGPFPEGINMKRREVRCKVLGIPYRRLINFCFLNRPR